MFFRSSMVPSVPREWLDFRTGPKGLGGTIDAIPLTDDLSAAAGESFMLFRGSDAPWNRERTNQTYVTDGPFLFKENGELYMLWSTSGWAGYTTLIAHSTSGKLAGPWEQFNETINASDGGHAMRFKTFDGKVMTAYHGPNSGATRVVLIEGKSPSVKMPSRALLSSTIATAPQRAAVMASRASRTDVPGRTLAACSPVRMKSLTFNVMERPMAPAGWSLA